VLVVYTDYCRLGCKVEAVWKDEPHAVEVEDFAHDLPGSRVDDAELQVHSQ